MLGAALAGLALLVLAAYELNPLCVVLLPIAALGIVLYPFCKRFTWGTHFVLGAVDGLAPLGAYVAVAGRIDPAPVLLFVAVTIWVAGFDIIYALMDRDVDLAQNLRSIPARFGAASGRRLPLAFARTDGRHPGRGRRARFRRAPVLPRNRLRRGADLVRIAPVRRFQDVFVLNEGVFNATWSFRSPS